MKYRVILVEHEAGRLSQLAGALKIDSDFDLAATFFKAEQALGQSSVFRPNLFLVDVDDSQNLNLLSICLLYLSSGYFQVAFQDIQ